MKTAKEKSICSHAGYFGHATTFFVKKLNSISAKRLGVIPLDSNAPMWGVFVKSFKSSGIPALIESFEGDCAMKFAKFHAMHLEKIISTPFTKIECLLQKSSCP
jgi:hypothetical protein